MTPILLHGANGSPFVRKLRIALAEKELPYEHIQTVPLTDPPPGLPFPCITADLKPHTPLGKIPFVRIGEHWLADSSVVIAYLERLHPQRPLYPAEAWDYARALWFEEFIDGGAVRKLFDTVFFERVLAPMLLGRPTDQTVVDRAIAIDLPAIYGYLDGEIGSREFLVGDRFSVADAAATSFFCSMQQANAAPDPARWPQLVRYIRHQQTRPSVARILAEEQAA